MALYNCKTFETDILLDTGCFPVIQLEFRSLRAYPSQAHINSYPPYHIPSSVSYWVAIAGPPCTVAIPASDDRSPWWRRVSIKSPSPNIWQAPAELGWVDFLASFDTCLGASLAFQLGVILLYPTVSVAQTLPRSNGFFRSRCVCKTWKACHWCKRIVCYSGGSTQ